ncbi:Importin subunit beta-2 [Bienertia sinuspersici]
MLWQDEIKVSLRCMHSWFIAVDIRDTSGEKWRLSRVYGLSSIGQKSKTWDLLRGLQERNHIPWLIIGDFNEVLYTSEKNGRNHCDFSLVLLFRGVADELNLCEPRTLVMGIRGSTESTRISLWGKAGTWPSLAQVASSVPGLKYNHCDLGWVGSFPDHPQLVYSS